MRFRVEASVGNGDGVFDAAYEFGRGASEEAQMCETPAEIGAEVARYLSLLTADDCREMRQGTSRFFIELILAPEDAPPRAGGNGCVG